MDGFPRLWTLTSLILALGLLGTTAVGPPDSRNAARESPSVQAPGPNIVVILTDDQRMDELRMLPAVRRLIVRRGTKFTQAFVPTTLCCPSRSTILTGLYSHDTGVWTNRAPTGGWLKFHQLGHEERTIAVTLQQAGYRTALVGKYLNQYGRYSPTGTKPPGWDTFSAFRLPGRSGAYYDYNLGSQARGFGRQPKDYSTDVLGRHAVRFITSTPAGRPLFLYFAPFAPHGPYQPAPRHLGVLRGKLPRYHPPSVGASLAGKPAYVRRKKPVPQRRINYVRRRQAETLLAVDDAVKSIVAALRRTDRLHNTMIVFMSDNGIQTGEHNIVGKNVPYREAAAIPMVIRWDSHVAAGATDGRLALNVDVAQTIADAADLPMRSDGLSLLGHRTRIGTVIEAAVKGRGARPAYCGWRSQEWLFVHYATGEEELYDEVNDHYELRNLAGDRLYEPVRLSLKAHAQRTCDPVPPGFSWS